MHYLLFGRMNGSAPFFLRIGIGGRGIGFPTVTPFGKPGACVD